MDQDLLNAVFDSFLKGEYIGKVGVVNQVLRLIHWGNPKYLTCEGEKIFKLAYSDVEWEWYHVWSFEKQCISVFSEIITIGEEDCMFERTDKAVELGGSMFNIHKTNNMILRLTLYFNPDTAEITNSYLGIIPENKQNELFLTPSQIKELSPFPKRDGEEWTSRQSGALVKAAR